MGTHVSGAGLGIRQPGICGLGCPHVRLALKECGRHGLHSAWQAGAQEKGTRRAWLQGTQKEAGVPQELMSHIQHTSHIQPV